MLFRSAGRKQEYALLDEWIKYQDDYARETEQGTNAVLDLLEGIRRIYMIDFSRHAEAVDDHIFCVGLGIQVERRVIQDDIGQPTGRQYYYFIASTRELLQMMQRYGREYGVKVPFSNPRQLGVRMKNEMQTIKNSGWSMADHKIVHGSRFKRFTWTDE